MWRELLLKHDAVIDFSTPATRSMIDSAVESLGVLLPDSLESLLLESDGFKAEYGCNLLWPVSRIVADNVAFRSNPDFLELYMPFDSLLFFADAGNGDQFAFVVLNGEISREDVFAWNHEDDSRSWIAPNIQTFYEWWLTDRISI